MADLGAVQTDTGGPPRTSGPTPDAASSPSSSAAAASGPAAPRSPTEALANSPTTADAISASRSYTDSIAAQPTAADSIAAQASAIGAITGAQAIATAQLSEAINSSDLRIGSTGYAVEQMQDMLNEKGQNAGPSDGAFGNNTLTAVQNFQRGRIDEIDQSLASGSPSINQALLTQQRTALESELNQNVASQQTIDQLSTLGVGDNGANVRRLQVDLNRMEHDAGTADGAFSDGTLIAVTSFQNERITELNTALQTILPISEIISVVQTRQILINERDANVAGPETLKQLDQKLDSSFIIQNKPVNADLKVAGGLVTDDPRIEQQHIPALESGAFANHITSVEKIVLHRTVTSTTEQTFASFNSGNNYGTHFVVGKDGTIYQTANLDQRTIHVAGHNSSSVGIEVVGMPLDAQGNTTLGPPNGNPVTSWEALTPEQADSVAYLTNSLNNYYGLPTDSIAVHENLAAKTAGEGATVYDAVQSDLIN